VHLSVSTEEKGGKGRKDAERNLLGVRKKLSIFGRGKGKCSKIAFCQRKREAPYLLLKGGKEKAGGGRDIPTEKKKGGKSSST